MSKMVKFSSKMVALKMLKVIAVIINQVKQTKIKTPTFHNRESFLQIGLTVWDIARFQE